ncbi:MAG: hypothetical protein K0Q75_2180 [Anaerospora sp.]|nr:hypothetical protein [Anaerospora sp.]
MEAKELIECIEKFLEVKAKELEEGRQLEILKGMLQTMKRIQWGWILLLISIFSEKAGFMKATTKFALTNLYKVSGN